MSESDSDWFEKDIEEFVVTRCSDKHNLLPDVSCAGAAITKNINYTDGEYGGCYTTEAIDGNRRTSDQEGEHTNDNRNSAKSTYIQPISFKKLSYLLDQNALNLFLDIIQTESGFFETLNRSSNSTEMILLTIKVILKIIETPFVEHIKVFLSKITGMIHYWNRIEAILKSTTIKQQAMTVSKQKRKNKKVILHQNDGELWENIYQLCYVLSKYIELPNQFVKNVLMIIDKNENHILNLTQFKLNFQQLCNEPNSAAVQDFKTYFQMDIYPTLDELKQKRKLHEYLKPNIVKGRFPSVAHYLDIHLALLREDFISPLRDGICQFIEQNNDDPNAMQRHNNNIRVYTNVRILVKQHTSKPNFRNDYLMVDLEAKSRHENSSHETINNNKYSKKLMYGSLLCFSSSPKFEDLIVAIVSHRDIDLLNQGFIQIEIIYSDNILSVFDRDLIMCESDVYFETYRHVYSVLKSFTEDTFPMKDYIINLDQSANLPEYIPEKGKVIYTYRQHALDLKNVSSWPSAAHMSLNGSQLDALKHALTRKFSVIQGPPGTGKTHMGLAIIAALLLNTDSQILIVSYTNHALDHFLNGILKYTDSIVRIGNQSKDEHLDSFNIKQLCENRISDKRVKNILFKLKLAYTDAVQEFHSLQNSEASDDIFEKYKNVQANIQSISRLQEEIKQIGEFQVIKSKRIIGITSTGAARCNVLIQLLQTPIVIFEEAAEILESHIVAALTKSVQHLILIGDHQQLRPSTSVYELAKKFQMDVSLFERMVNNNIHCVTLDTQYRMRPEIANLIRPTIYKTLIDDDSVKQFGNITGMFKNLYFINHIEQESGENDETTKRNVFESQYMVALCNYLILQGYRTNEITILTTYNGQISQFAQDRKKFPNLRKVRITAVDNFQGEDNKIILLSLVRSNLTNNIGYLAFKNRICVALSRAKQGLYIIGNMDVLSKASSIWKQIDIELQNQDAIGPELELICSTHQAVQKIYQPKNFDDLTFGGCNQKCDIQLKCGHRCSFQCHTNAFDHLCDCQCIF